MAFQDAGEIRANFVAALELLLAHGSYVGIATHDEWLIERAVELVEQHDLGREDYEFQMLLGVRERRASELVRDGHRVRIYVPFGEPGTSTRCAGSRRTPSSPATSRRTRSAGSSPAATAR